MARECYTACLRILSRYVLRKKDVNLLSIKGDFDPQLNDEPCVEPKDKIIPLHIEKSRQNM